jgi:hypothetical protein
MKRSKTSKKTGKKHRRNKTAEAEKQKHVKPNISESEAKPIKRKNIISRVVTAMIFLGAIGGFFTDVFSPLKKGVMQFADPPDYWYCEQDRNIRGFILPPEAGEDGEINLVLGFNNRTDISTNMNHIGNDTSIRFCLVDFREKNGCPLYFKIDKEHRVLISADIYDIDGCLAGKIVDNEFVLNKNCQFTWNLDDSAFEVVGSDFKVVFSIGFGQWFQRNPAIFVQGIFGTGDEFMILNDHTSSLHCQIIDKNDVSKLEEAKETLQPIFEYFGKDWFGKRKVY